MNDRGYLFDAAGEIAGQRQRQVDLTIEQVMANVDQLMDAMAGDEGDLLREIVGKLIQPGESKERYFDALSVLERRARHYAEGQVDG